jgi:hypothetical protein
VEPALIGQLAFAGAPYRSLVAAMMPAGSDRGRPLRLVAAAEPSPYPDPRPLTRRLAQAIAEVLVGLRAAGQLSAVAATDVTRLLTRNTGRLGTPPGTPQQRPIVASVHVREPCPAVAEACAVIDLGQRKRVIALRLEAADGQWRCTALHIG